MTEKKFSPKTDDAVASWPDQEGNQPVSLFIFLCYSIPNMPFPSTNHWLRKN